MFQNSKQFNSLLTMWRIKCRVERTKRLVAPPSLDFILIELQNFQFQNLEICE